MNRGGVDLNEVGPPVLLSGETFPKRPMYTGKTLFAQLMDFLPWTTFARIVERYSGDRYVKSLRYTEHFRVIAFAQLRNAVAIQQRVGIRAITHGELRRNNWRD